MLKTKQSLLLFLFLSATILVAQNEILVPFKAGKKWGFSNMNQQLKIDAVYDSVSHFPFYLEQKNATKLTRVMQNGSWGLINMKGEVVIPIEYKQLNEVSVAHNPNYYVVQHKNGKFGLLHHDTFLTKIDYDTLSYHYNYISAQKGNTIGILDLSGKVKIPLEYYQIILLRKFYSTKSLREDWKLVGNELVSEKAKIRIQFPAAVDKSKTFYIWSLTNAKETKYLITSGFQELTNTEETNEEVYEVEETVISSMETKTTTPKRKKNYKAFAAKGYVFWTDFEDYQRFYKFKKSGGGLGIFDVEANREIVPPLYHGITVYEYHSKKYFATKINRKSGLYDQNGTEIFPTEYKLINYRDFLTLEKDGKTAFFSIKTGQKSSLNYEFIKVISYFEYDENQQLFLKVKRNGIIFYMDEKMNEYYQE